MRRLPHLALALLVAVSAARADELRLKDGTKVVGTIVGFEDNAFKVQTSYGFALVRKDQVVSISVSPASEKKAATEKKNAAPESASAKASAAPAETSKAPANGEEKPSSAPMKETSAAPAKETAAKQSAKAHVVTASKAPNASSAAAAPPPAPEPPRPAPEPPMREEVNGNAYANLTYGFRMYKPPDWRVIVEARKMLPGAITAMGTSDETTYLVISQEALNKPIASQIASTEQRLREIMENYRPTGEKQIVVSGAPATERRFRGSVDGRDWSGIVAFIPHGNSLFTVFGMTYAESDLVQIQENVIRRAITSLEFTSE
jgi:hypothetical protein